MLICVLAGNNVGVNPPTYLPGSPEIVITYKAVLSTTVKANSTVSTNATVLYLSAPYTGTNNKYVLETKEHLNSSLVVAAPSANITLLNTSIPETIGDRVSVGEVATLRAVLQLPQGTTANSTLISIITPTLRYNRVSITFLPSAITTSNTVSVGSQGSPVDSNGDGVTDSMVFTLGDVVNTPDGVQNGPNDIIVLEIEVTVVNTSALLQAGLLLNYSSYQVVAVPVTLNEAIPEIVFSASYNLTTGDAGDSVNASVKISHGASSSSPAFNLNVSAILPRMDMVSGSLFFTAFNTTAFIGSSGLVSIPTFSIGAEVWVYFSFVLNVSVVSGSYVPATIVGTLETAPVNGTVMTATNVYNFTIPLLSSNLTLGYKSNPDSNNSISVGEYFAYHVTIRLPEGTTLSPTEIVTVPPFLTDTMSLLNVSVHSAGEHVVYEKLEWTAFSSVLNPNSNDTAIATFDSMINYPDQNTTNDFIVLAFYGVVLPTANLDNGLQVSSQLAYFNGTHIITEAGQNRTESVVNPKLNVTQVCIPDNSGIVQGGTQYSCSLTVFPDSPITAYNVTIGNAAATFSGVVANSVSSSHGQRVVYYGDGTFEIIISVYNPGYNYNITVNYTVVLTDDVESGTNITLPAIIKYLSSPSAFGTSYRTLSEVPITVALLNSTISVNSSSLSVAPTTNVSIGEVVSLFYNIDLIQGMASSASLVASLPNGFTVLSSKVVSVGNSDGCTVLSNGDAGAVTDENGDGKDDTASFVFGDLCNQIDGILDADDQVVIEVVALVEDIPSNVAGSLLAVNGSLSFTNYTVLSNITLMIVEPVLTWSLEWSSATADAGDNVVASVVLEHSTNSTAGAYNLDVFALLTPFLELVQGTVSSNDSLSTVVGVPVSWDGISRINVLPLGGSVQVNFTVTLTTAVIAGTNITVPVASNYSSAPTLGRLSAIAMNATIIVSPFPSTALTVGRSSNVETPAGLLTIGEIVESVVTITIPEGTTLALSVYYKLSNSSGVHILSVSALYSTHISAGTENITVFSSSSEPLTNDTATFGVDTLLNLPDGDAAKDVVTLAVTWVVLPHTTLSSGSAIEATSEFSFSNGTTTLVEAVQNNTFTLVISDIQLVQECIPQTSRVQSGTSFVCVITLFSPNATAPAYNITIKNSASIYTTVVGSSTSISNGTIEEDGVEFVAFIPVFDPAVKSNITVQYSVTLTNEVVSGLAVAFPAYIAFLSSPTVYGLLTESNITTLAIVDSPVVEMMVNYTSLSTTGPSTNVSVGEKISMVYTITMVEGRTKEAFLTTNVSSGLSVVNAWVVALGNSACGELEIGSFGNLSDTDGDGLNDTVAFNFGLLCNDADGVDNAGDQVVVEAILAVMDVPINQPQSNVSVSGSLQFSNQSISMGNATFYIVQPDLLFNITANTTSVQAGSIVEFTIVSNHTQNSTAAAYDFNLLVLSSPYMQFVNTCDPSSSLINARFDNTSVNVPIQVLNSSVQYTLCAKVLPHAPTSTDFNLTLFVEYYTAPAVLIPAARSFNSTWIVPHKTLDPVQTLEVAATSNFPNATGNNNVSVGDTVTFNSTILIPAGITTSPSFVLSLVHQDVVLALVSVNVTNFTTELMDLNQDGHNESVSLQFPQELVYETQQLILVEVKAVIVSINEQLLPPVVANMSQYWSNNGSATNFTSQVQVQLFVNPLPVPTTYYFTTWKNAPLSFDVVTGCSSPYLDIPDQVISYTHGSNGDVTAANTTVLNATYAITPATYSPSLNYVGLDIFNYTVRNSINGVGVGTVYVQVNYTNYPPIPFPDNVTTYENTLVQIFVLENDFDVVCSIFILFYF